MGFFEANYILCPNPAPKFLKFIQSKDAITLSEIYMQILCNTCFKSNIQRQVAYRYYTKNLTLRIIMAGKCSAMMFISKKNIYIRDLYFLCFISLKAFPNIRTGQVYTRNSFLLINHPSLCSRALCALNFCINSESGLLNLFSLSVNSSLDFIMSIITADCQSPCS